MINIWIVVKIYWSLYQFHSASEKKMKEKIRFMSGSVVSRYVSVDFGNSCGHCKEI